MLKTIRLLDKPVSSRNDGKMSVSNKNNDSRPASRENNSNNKVNGFGGGSVELAKKSGKLKGQKLAKFRKLSKSRKSKSKK